jgi:signal transduction histidine kinase
MIAGSMVALAAASTVTLLGISLAYYFAFRSYSSKYFLYILWAWALNALYIIVEALISYFPTEDLQTIFPRAVYENLAYFASLPTTFAYFLAYLRLPQKPISERRALILVVSALLTIVFAFLAAEYLLPDYPRSRFSVTVAPGVILTAAVLLILSRSFFRSDDQRLLDLLWGARLHRKVDHNHIPIDLKGRIEHTIDPSERLETSYLRKARLLFAYSFGGYGLIQFAYLAKPHLGNTLPFISFFYIAYLLKIMNGLGVPYLILADIRRSEEFMKIKSLTQELGAITAGVEHDIRTPTSNILKKLRTMKRRFVTESAIQQDITFILDEVGLIRAALEDILIIRETKDYYEKRFRSINLADLLNLAVKQVRKKFNGSRFSIKVTTVKPGIRIIGYQKRLLQAFINIITNGVEACLDNRINPKLRITCDKNAISRAAYINIYDFGKGIPEDIMPRITHPMFTTKDLSVSNRGLGLFTTSKIIYQHYGKMKFKSDGSSYTEVIVELPLEPSAIRRNIDDKQDSFT